MKVYTLIGHTKYGGGRAIVVAGNKDEAIETAGIEDYTWVSDQGFNYINVERTKGMFTSFKRPRVISNFTWIE